MSTVTDKIINKFEAAISANEKALKTKRGEEFRVNIEKKVAQWKSAIEIVREVEKRYG